MQHDQTFVHATPTSVLARLPARLTLGATTVDLARDWQAGPAEGTWRTRAAWQRGRRRGAGVVEVRPAGWGWSELALTWQGAAVPAQHLAAYVEDRTPVPASTHRRRPAPRRAVLAVASAAALVGAALVVLPVGTATPVTSEAALSGFRAATGSDAATGAGTPAPPPSTPSPTSSEATPRDARGDAATPLTADTDRAGDTAPAPATPTTAPPSADATPVAPPGGERSEAPPQPRAPAADRDRPAPGVYRYATDGWEELDVRGSHRRFPDETAQVIHHTGCGYRQIWEPLEERRDEHAFCIDSDPPALVTTATARSFFGQDREQDFACAPGTVRDDGWTTRCDDGDGTAMTVTTRRVGTERRTVGGEAVEVAKLRVAADLTGETSGQRRSTVWMRSSDGLVVRAEVEADLEVPGPFGTVRYRERYELDLLDLAPRR